VTDGTVLDGGDEDEVGMAEGEGRHVRELACDVAGADRELSPDEPIDTAQAGCEQLPDQLRVCRVERVDSLEEAGECLGLDVGAPLGQHILPWPGQLADAGQQQSGEGDRGGAAFGLGPGEEDGDGGVADVAGHPRAEQPVAEFAEWDVAGREGRPDEPSVEAHR
jgi:hypothetical protein